jgi:glycosyltransferase involved in cell wall biosynthesis
VRIALVALSVRGAMGDYIDALIKPLSESEQVSLFVPEHYHGQSGKASLQLFQSGSNKLQASFHLLNPVSALEVWQRIEASKPDVIHLFNGEGYPWSLLWVYWAKKKQIPVVITVHDPQPHPGNFFELINSYLRHFTIRSCAAIHIHSKRFLETFLVQGIPSNKVYAIPHGNIARRFLLHQSNDIEKESLVLFFGRLEAYKGIDILVKAAQYLQGKYKICIAGPGKLPSNLKSEITRNPNLFEFHNRYLADAEVAKLFQRASICALPYKQATQSSLPMIAASFGVSIVASSVGNFIDEIPLLNGILVPPNNPYALAQAILTKSFQKPKCLSDYNFENLVPLYSQLYSNVHMASNLCLGLADVK